jgi:hypothetical protein
LRQKKKKKKKKEENSGPTLLLPFVKDNSGSFALFHNHHPNALPAACRFNLLFLFFPTNIQSSV